MDKKAHKSESGNKTWKSGAAEKYECRCKEVSSKSFSGLLRLMLKDLAFWRRSKKAK